MKKNEICIVDRGKYGGVVGIVTTRAGYVYACSWAQGTELTEATVREVWRDDRRAFRPYDESAGVYCDTRST